jgi:hypothetical protein
VDLFRGDGKVQPVNRKSIAILPRELVSLDGEIFRQRSSHVMPGIAAARAI